METHGRFSFDREAHDVDVRDRRSRAGSATGTHEKIAPAATRQNPEAERELRRDKKQVLADLESRVEVRMTVLPPGPTRPAACADTYTEGPINTASGTMYTRKAEPSPMSWPRVQSASTANLDAGAGSLRAVGTGCAPDAADAPAPVASVVVDVSAAAAAERAAEPGASTDLASISRVRLQEARHENPRAHVVGPQGHLERIIAKGDVAAERDVAPRRQRRGNRGPRLEEIGRGKRAFCSDVPHAVR